jgi:hypothetical protein
MSGDIVTKAAVSVTEMAKMVGLSRARFYQLVKKGVFPPADQDALSERPCYFAEKQRLILEARRRNCGVDGSPILFYCRRNDAGQKRAAVQPAKPKASDHQFADLIDLLAQVRIAVTTAQVEAAVKEKFPNGTDGIDASVVLDALIERFGRQNPPGKQGR